MLLSLITPTHNTRFLERLARSIFSQSFKNYEWIIVPNGGASLNGFTTPQQVRIVPYSGATQNVGELKRFCCEQAKGDILVEVDHDDELTPNCLDRLAETFLTNDCQFAYSNCAEINADGSPRVYGDRFGWETRDFAWNGKKIKELVAFDPSPASFSKIWYAPNHVRAWHRDFYWKIGGHNAARAVLDDHELLCKTYLKGKVQHIDECLYVQHVHGGSTCYSREHNAAIQSGTLGIHDRFIYPLVERWCDLNGLRKIDLCGAHGKPIGYESVDIHDADILADLNGHWPFEDGSVGVFRAHDALEHMRDPIHTMREVYRCLAPNGWLLSLTPSTDGRGAWQDPTHCSYWNRNSFFYYTRAQQAKYIGTPVRFQENRIKDFYPSAWHETNKIAYVKADLLKASGRTPGLVEI